MQPYAKKSSSFNSYQDVPIDLSGTASATSPEAPGHPLQFEPRLRSNMNESVGSSLMPPFSSLGPQPMPCPVQPTFVPPAAVLAQCPRAGSAAESPGTATRTERAFKNEATACSASSARTNANTGITSSTSTTSSATILGDSRIASGTAPNDGTALLLAAFRNNVEDVASLIKQGAQVNLVHAEFGCTALMAAAEEGHMAVVSLLLKQQGIDLDKQDPDGETALTIAVCNDRADVVACLLAAGASWQLVDESGFNALEHAIFQNHVPIVETFLDRGIKPAGDNVAALLNNKDVMSVAMIDLMKAGNPPGFVVGEFSQQRSFFIHALAIAYSDGNHEFILRHLVENGMSWVCAIQVVTMLMDPRAPSMKGANLQQNLVYFFSTLTRLGVLGADTAVIDRYQRAGISAAGVKRLGRIARMQLSDLAELAAKALSVIGSNMVNALIDNCTSGTSLDYQVDIPALKQKLITQGFCAPVAQAIATSWQGAITKPRETTRLTTAGWLWLQLASYLRMRVVQYEPAGFAHELLRLLDSRDLLKQLGAMMGDINDEGMHAQFQIQCDQLRQYCRQLLASTAASSIQASQ